MEKTITVAEWMAEFIRWANEQGEDGLRQMVREHINDIKKQHDVSLDSHVDEGYQWNEILEPNDGNDQWKHGGDCTLCRKVKYCNKKCRANRLLKKIATPYLYNKYLEDNPEASVKQIAGIDSAALLKQLGITP